MLDSIRRPEYTGSNRCRPCTLVNGVLVLGIVLVLTIARRRRLAALVGLLGTAAIALRGYVVPGTPRYAPKLVARLPALAALFDHEELTGAAPEPGALADAGAAADGPDGEAVLEALLDAGVVDLEGEDVTLTPAVRTRWEREMATLRTHSLEELAAVADAETPAAVATAPERWSDREYVVLAGDRERTLLSRPVAIAELAAARTLADDITDDRLRTAAGSPLRTLLETCPACETELVRTSAACCGEVTTPGSKPTEKLVCPSCRVRLFTFPTEP